MTDSQVIEMHATYTRIQIEELDTLMRDHPQHFVDTTAAEILLMYLKLGAMVKRLETRRAA